MATESSTSASAGPAASAGAARLQAHLTSADSRVQSMMARAATMHQARLSDSKRIAAAYAAKYGSADPRSARAQASAVAINSAIAHVTMAHRALTTPIIAVAGNAWAIQGLVVDSQLQPAFRFTVFFVDAAKTFQRQYGFAYTDATGYFLLKYTEENKDAPATPPLFMEVANPQASPVYIAANAITPSLGSVSYQTIVLPTGEIPIGDPPSAIRKTALPPNEENQAL